ncbi:hypothetical protein [Faecalispora anaeroviscerum]|uniref:hypothetical protein n=1 Tax=Faecalispora anaeroviscerum TaxID=2991836 RepID=UPI0024B8B392|nr:hypothetical protein [Faecalispora anaeroviscerum]
MKKKDMGEPTVTVHFLPGTAEDVAKNRAAFQAALEMGLSRLNGCKTKVELDWDGNEENYRSYREGKLKEPGEGK